MCDKKAFLIERYSDMVDPPQALAGKPPVKISFTPPQDNRAHIKPYLRVTLDKETAAIKGAEIGVTGKIPL